jgi:hypothetical protein
MHTHASNAPHAHGGGLHVPTEEPRVVWLNKGAPRSCLRTQKFVVTQLGTFVPGPLAGVPVDRPTHALYPQRSCTQYVLMSCLLHPKYVPQHLCPRQCACVEFLLLSRLSSHACVQVCRWVYTFHMHGHAQRPFRWTCFEYRLSLINAPESSDIYVYICIVPRTGTYI